MGGKVGTGTVGVGTPVCGVGVGVPAKGVGVDGPVVGVRIGVGPPPATGVLVGGTDVEPGWGGGVPAGGAPVRVGSPDTGDPSGGAVGAVPPFRGVGVGLARPLSGSVGDLESHAPRIAARKSPARRNGTNARTGTG